MPSILTPDFQKSIADLRQSFPAQLDKLVVLTTGSLNPVFISPKIANELSGKTAVFKRALDAFQQRPILKGIASNNYPAGDHIVRLVALNENMQGVYSDRFTKEMDVTYVFDHEMGHVVAKNGIGISIRSQLKECVADAYAFLRHVQRFGKNAGIFEYNARAYPIVLGMSSAHYTNAVVEAVKTLSEQEDISGWSLEKTAEMASEIAENCQLSEERLNKISNAYAPVARACRKNIGDDLEIIKKLSHENDAAWPMMFRETIKVMRDHKDDPDIFQAGKAFLNHPARRECMVKLARVDQEWKSDLDFIDAQKRNPLLKRIITP